MADVTTDGARIPARARRLPLRPLRRHRLRRRRGAPDGHAVPLPAPAGRAPPRAVAQRGHPAQVPRRVLRPAAGHPAPGPDRPRPARLRALDRRAPRRGRRAVVRGRRRHRQDDAGDARLEGGARRRALRGDLLAAAAARRDPGDLRGRHRGLVRRLPRPAGRGRPAARRRRRRREDEPLGARAALRDRQRPLRGREGHRHHDEPAAGRARRPDRVPHGVAAEGDVRGAPAVRRGRQGVPDAAA